MSYLQAQPRNAISTKAKAVKDAQQMQASIIVAARKFGKDPPKYVLMELIGKGSYGRVYKGKDIATTEIVAVKIIDLDESDTANPRNADSYSEFLKEIGALKILSESKARNINHVIDALSVGQTMWMITEYCGGGSVATLMKPTAPGGLQEKWIIPILREVAEAIKWVHDAGANILVTELGGVQLCDFGIAGTLETKLDKRSTFIGTLHWMAPELFDSDPSYGKEVDIWAFGCMIFEIATGLPPNVDVGVPFRRNGPHSEFHVPRLEGGNYSNDLRGIAAYCLEELPSLRPTIVEVQKHSYIWGSKSKYPTPSLVHLVRAFKMWEDHVGSRESLFMPGGAQSLVEASLNSMADDEWNFSNTAAFDQDISNQSTAEVVYDAYGTTSELKDIFSEETTRFQKPSRRRPPPQALARLPAPLEKVFDPNTLSSYEDNSKNHYGRPPQLLASDLPLRDTYQSLLKDTMIDLDGHDSDTGLSTFPGMDTIKAGRYASREVAEDRHSLTFHEIGYLARSDPEDININRRTQDWKFPMILPPASADTEISRFPADYDPPRSVVTASSGIEAALGGGALDSQQASVDRSFTRESLIDLDMSFPDVVTPSARPSTANSEASSTNSDQIAPSNSFELEKHASFYTTFPDNSISGTEASISSTSTDSKHSDMRPPPLPTQAPFIPNANLPYTISHVPDLPSPPSTKGLSGLATHNEIKEEFNRMLQSMTLQLEALRDSYRARDKCRSDEVGPSSKSRDNAPV